MDARCDLFSLGVILYRLCCGQQPFHGTDTVSTLLAVATHQPHPPSQINPDLPQELSDLVMQLLEKDPARRPGSAAEVVEFLRALEQNPRRSKEIQEETVLVGTAPPKGSAASAKRRLPVLIGALVLGVGLLAVAAGTLIRIQTEQGVYVIETDDPDFSFRVNKGEVILEDHKTKRIYQLKVLHQDQAKGEHELEVTDAADLSFQTKTFRIKRGEKVALKAWVERKPGAAPAETPTTVDDAWVKRVAALPAEKQVAAVAAMLKERNPGFDGQLKPTIETWEVTGLELLTDHVKDISPVRAFPELRVLNCSGTYAEGKGHGQLVDLSALKDMQLTSLACYHTQVTDLSPLKNMKLTSLKCGGAPVADLSPLKDMQLTSLDCRSTRVADLSPLKDMKLTYLNCSDTRVADLSPLKNMQLTGLSCESTQVADLSPLKDMKLTHLVCSRTQVIDLSPLKNMQLTTLSCHGTKVADLTPLKGIPLQELSCDFKPERDAAILRSIKTLKTINGKPAAEVLK